MFLCNVGTNAGAPDHYAAGGYFGEKWQEPDGLYYHGLHGDRLRDMYREVGEALCESPDGTVKGDNFESTGPLDPTFFLIHPTMDRLFQVRGSAHGGRQTEGRLVEAISEASSHRTWRIRLLPLSLSSCGPPFRMAAMK